MYRRAAVRMCSGERGGGVEEEEEETREEEETKSERERVKVKG